MIKQQTRWVSLALAVVLAFWGITAIASAQATVTPAQTTISGTRYTNAERILLVQTSESLTGLRFVALDLPDIAGEQVLPAGAIQATLPTTELAAGSFLTLPLTVELTGVPSGQYQGEVQLWHDDGQISLPLTVRVRDFWLGPLLILLIGVGLAVIMSAYRARGKPRDELLARIGLIQTDIGQEEALDEQFEARIKAALAAVQTALRTQKWNEAQAALERAEGYWQRWQQRRTDWLAQLGYARQLEEKIANQHVPQSRYLQKVARVLTTVRRRAPELGTPEQLQEQLESLTVQFNRYISLKERIDQVGQMATNQLPPDLSLTWRQRARDWEQQLDNLEPHDENSWKELYAVVRSGQQELEQSVNESDPSLGSKSVHRPALAFLTPPTIIDSDSDEEFTASQEAATPTTVSALRRLLQFWQWLFADENAPLRLRLFNMLGYALAVVFLAGAGFAELYVGKATFGNNPWGDYLALLAWGFGAEASRAAVVDMLKGWGLPGF